MSLLTFAEVSVMGFPGLLAARQRGVWLRTKRQNRGLTLGDMARAAGMRVPDYSSLERGHVDEPDPLAWLRLCTLLECRIDDWQMSVVDLTKRLTIWRCGPEPGACPHLEVVAREDDPDDGRCVSCGETGFPMSWDESEYLEEKER